MPPLCQNTVSYTYLGMKQLVAGGGIIVIAQTVISQLATLF